MSAALTVFDANHRPVRLGAELGRGGEAAIYRLASKPGQAAKIYHREARAGYDQKLAWMQGHPPADPTRAQGHAAIAWPNDLLYDGSGKLVGYTMVQVQNAVPLLQVFNPRLRAKTLPSFNRRYLHRTARNLAAALGALHDSGYIVGDLNESNVMVTPTALITLIDADSFQVQRRIGAKPMLYPCPVGRAEYTPPELQGKTFAETARLPEHDRFGLAVLIFQLLLEGNHPFRAQWKGAGDPPPVEDRIRDGHWPYAAKPGLPITPPPGAPTLDVLHPGLADLARQCFIEGYANPARRPAPEAWQRAIAAAEKALVPCRNGHVYSRHLRHCPDCEASRQRKAAAARAAQRAAQSSPRAGTWSSARSTRRASRPQAASPRGVAGRRACQAFRGLAAGPLMAALSRPAPAPAWRASWADRLRAIPRSPRVLGASGAMLGGFLGLLLGLLLGHARLGLLLGGLAVGAGAVLTRSLASAVLDRPAAVRHGQRVGALGGWLSAVGGLLAAIAIAAEPGPELGLTATRALATGGLYVGLFSAAAAAAVGGAAGALLGARLGALGRDLARWPGAILGGSLAWAGGSLAGGLAGGAYAAHVLGTDLAAGAVVGAGLEMLAAPALLAAFIRLRQRWRQVKP
jgi:hypothetical protein